MNDSPPAFMSDALARTLPAKIDYGIAFVGCGGIVNYGHIPAYRACGFRLMGGYDAAPEAAERTARAHGLEHVYRSLDELLSDRAVDIVDVAILPGHQLGVVRQAAAASKHLLCQKPLADRYPDAVSAVQTARAAGHKLAVQQQFRWSPIIRATRALLADGWLGELLDVQVQVSISTPWDLWPWLASQPGLEVRYHSIHYLDALRFLFGEPAWVTSRHARHPAQSAVGETKTITAWDYPSGLQILIAVCHFDWSPARYSLLRVLGTAGLLEGTIGTNYDYPHGRNDTLQFTSRDWPERNFRATLPGKWIPDAFYGPMASLMQAIQTGGEAVTSGEDNLGTLRVVEAAYRSMAGRRSVAPEEIAA